MRVPLIQIAGNIITGSSRCVKFSTTRPNKKADILHIWKYPGTRFTRVLRFCVIFTFSWTVVRSSRLLIHIGCPSIVTFKRNSEFVTHMTHFCFVLIQYNRFSTSKGVVFVKTKTCPVRVTRPAGSVLMLCYGGFTRVLCALYRCMLRQHARTAIRRWMASAGPSEFLPAPGFWIFIFFGAIHFTRFRCSEKGFCVEPSWCPVEAMDGFINLLSVGFLFFVSF